MRVVKRSDGSGAVQVCGWKEKTGRKEVGRKAGLDQGKDRRRGEVKIKAEVVLREMEEGGEEEKDRMKGRGRVDFS